MQFRRNSTDLGNKTDLRHCCCCLVTQPCLTLYNSMDCSKPGFPVLHCLTEFVQNHVPESVMPSSLLNFCCLLLLPSIFSSIRVFSNELARHIWWPKYWSSNFGISPSNEYSELISFRIDWCHLLAIQGALKSLFQQHSLKASILRCSAFFVVQLSHLYMTTRKTRAFTIQTFVGKVMSLLFSTLSMFVIAFLLRRKHLLISWVHSLSAVILEPKKIKSVTAVFIHLFTMK